MSTAVKTEEEPSKPMIKQTFGLGLMSLFSMVPYEQLPGVIALNREMLSIFERFDHIASEAEWHAIFAKLLESLEATTFPEIMMYSKPKTKEN